MPNLLSSDGWSVALARPKASLSHCDAEKIWVERLVWELSGKIDEQFAYFCIKHHLIETNYNL